jgi:phosphoribosylformylglycinamidine synthase
MAAVPPAAAFFGESQGRFVLSASPRSIPALQQLARDHGVELSLLGVTGGDAVEFSGQLQVPLSDLRHAWEGALQ